MNKTRRIVLCGVMCALAFGLSYVDMLIPFDFAIPGIKLGLANLVIVVALYRLKPMDALLINATRVILAGILFGNITSFSFAMAGAICSFFVMYMLHRLTKLHVVVISILGAIAHVIGQLCVGFFYYPSKAILYYSMFLLVAAFITGAVLGELASVLIKTISSQVIGNNAKEL